VYCSGRITKKASTRLRWSLRRVGDSVRNSRSAKKDTSPNSTVAVASPDSQPIQNTMAMTQLLRSTPSARASSTRRQPRPAAWRHAPGSTAGRS
jgi:hypothetical protein